MTMNQSSGLPPIVNVPPPDRSRYWIIAAVILGIIVAVLAALGAVVVILLYFHHGAVVRQPVATLPQPTIISEPLTPATTAPQPSRLAMGYPAQPPTGWQSITDADIDGIDYSDLEPDTSDVTPLAPNLDNANADDDRKKRLDDFVDKLSDWPPGKSEDPVQKARSLISVAAAADVAQDVNEAEVPYIVFQVLKAEIPKEQLIKVLAYIVLHPNEGTVVTTAPELGLDNGGPEDEIRVRTGAYARKLLARLVGKILEAK